MSGVVILKDGRRVFDHSGEHAVGGRVATPIEPGGKHKIVPDAKGDGTFWCLAIVDGRWCFRSIHLHLGHWRHAKRTYVSR